MHTQHFSGRLFAFLTLLTALVCATPAPVQADPALVAETEALSPSEQQQLFRLPPGFVIELVASEPEVQKPINMKFDRDGSLYVTQSIEYPWAAAEGVTPRDTIKRIIDTNGDGAPDKVTTYAAGLNIPIGVTPVGHGVLGYSIPTLYRFTDTNGDGAADTREELYRSFGFRDTHGMCSSLNWWIDGWVYGCHGFANESTVTGTSGPAISLQSGNTYRLRPDGTHIEYYTHGQVNPFGMCFDEWGHVFTSDCHSRPAYQLVRGGYYPSFGKPHDGLGYGPELLNHSHESTGISGIAYYADDQFPAEYRQNLFIGNPVTGRINRDRLDNHGATYQAIWQPDFISCDDPWFRPVDVQLGPDGALYIADFYNCMIGHYEVPLDHPRRDRSKGRIWRIRYTGDGTIPARSFKPLNEQSMDELITMLSSASLPLRTMATHELVTRFGSAVAQPLDRLIANPASETTAVAHALYVLERTTGLSVLQLDKALHHAAPQVRAHALRILGNRGVWSQEELALATAGLADTHSQVIVAAVEACGRHPQQASYQSIIAAWSKAAADDGILAHTCRIAVRDVLAKSPAPVRLVDEHGEPVPDMPRLVEAALGLPGPQAARTLVQLMALASGSPIPKTVEVLECLGQHAEQIESLTSQVVAILQRIPPRERWWPMQGFDTGLARRNQRPADSFFRLAGETVEAMWSEGQPDDRRIICELVRRWNLTEMSNRLEAWVNDPQFPTDQKGEAMKSLIAVDRAKGLALSSSLFQAEALPQWLKGTIAEALADTGAEDSLEFVANQLRQAPREQAAVLARALVRHPQGGKKLFELVEQGKLAPGLLQDTFIQERLRAAEIEDFDTRLARQIDNLPSEDTLALEKMAQQKGFIVARSLHVQPVSVDTLERGKEAFKKNCANCHRLQNTGGKVGPELDGLGVRGLDRLLEDVMLPSRNVDATFRATLIELADGRVLTGLVQREEGDQLVLIDQDAKEVRIPLSEIETRKVLAMSPMPAGMADKLDPTDFGSLMAYLLSQRRPVAP